MQRASFEAAAQRRAAPNRNERAKGRNDVEKRRRGGADDAPMACSKSAFREASRCARRKLLLMLLRVSSLTRPLTPPAPRVWNSSVEPAKKCDGSAWNCCFLLEIARGATSSRALIKRPLFRRGARTSTVCAKSRGLFSSLFLPATRGEARGE